MSEKDMYLPKWVFKFGVFLLCLAAAVFLLLSVIGPIVCVIISLLFLGLAAAMLLCWKNQWARVINEEEFEYSTALGKRTVYKFSQITGLKRNPDSWTLQLGNKKVHIEACAVISEAFARRIDQAAKRV